MVKPVDKPRLESMHVPATADRRGLGGRAVALAAGAAYLLVGSTLIYGVKPTDVGMASSEAWRVIQIGSAAGIAIFSIAWMLVSLGFLGVAYWAIGRTTKPQMSLRAAAWGLGAIAVIGLSSYLPYLAVDLALEKVLETDLRQNGSQLYFRFYWMAAVGAGLGAVAIAVVLRAFPRWRNERGAEARN